MDDPISRAAAKAELMQMVERHRHETFRGELLHYTGIKAMLEAQPAIDAIPVEWLEKRRKNLLLAAMVHSTVYGDNSVELCHAVNVVLDMWQQEQEAR